MVFLHYKALYMMHYCKQKSANQSLALFCVVFFCSFIYGLEFGDYMHDLTMKNDHSLYVQQIEQFKDRLKECIGDESIRSFSKRCDISESVIRKYLAGSYPVLDKLPRIAEATGRSMEWLLSGSLTNKEYNQTETDDEIVYISKLDICLSAGYGSYPTDHALSINHRPFSKKWLMKKGLNVNNLYLVRVDGDSMEPLLKDKDIIMLDISKRIPTDSMPYAVRVDDTLYVKILRKQGSQLILHSLNNFYPPVIVDLTYDNYEIIGAIVWHAHSWV